MTDIPNDVFTREEALALCRRFLSMTTMRDAQAFVWSTLETKNTLVRGDAWMASEGWQTGAGLELGDAGRSTRVGITQTDEASMREAVEEAESMLRMNPAEGYPVQLLPKYDFADGPKVRFESTIEAMSAERRYETCRDILQTIEGRGVIAAGNIGQRLYSIAGVNTSGYESYATTSYGEVNISARTSNGKGSGWTWSGYEDWARIKPGELAARAADLAVRSSNPVAIEPGRYTVILEPNVVATLMWPLIGRAQEADGGGTPFSTKPPGSNKMGLKMLSESLSLKTDLWDPELPQPSVSVWFGHAKANVTWFDRGVLTNMVMGGTYAKAHNRKSVVRPEGLTLFGQGPTQRLEEMIASTKRGIWVNRVGNVARMNEETALRTGTTRDGTFLIENGQITKAIKNLRFNESIFFMLNRLEAFGEPVRASGDAVAPRLKVRDFDFTSLTDAV